MDHTLAPGTVLQGRYRIEGIVGQGGMAVVYSAYDLQFKVRVAVKQMTVKMARADDQAAVLSQFEQEAQILRSLNHENIPRVYAFFEEGSEYYVVMDFVDGCPLADTMTLRSDGTPERLPSLADVLDWGSQIAGALDYLHNHKPQPIIYKDLKPANVMLTPRGRIMLLDFGLARAIDLDGSHPTILKGSGTPGFSPPEQRELQPDLRCDPRVDLYALGATLYNLLTGKAPPDMADRRLSRGSALDAIAAIKVPLPEELEKLLRHLMAVNREDRLTSAREAAARLQAIRAGLGGRTLDIPTLPLGVQMPTLAMPVGRLDSPTPRRPIAAVAALGAAVVMVLFLGWHFAARTGGRAPGMPASAVSQSGGPGADVPTPTPTVFKLDRQEE